MSAHNPFARKFRTRSGQPIPIQGGIAGGPLGTGPIDIFNPGIGSGFVDIAGFAAGIQLHLFINGFYVCLYPSNFLRIVHQPLSRSRGEGGHESVPLPVSKRGRPGH